MDVERCETKIFMSNLENRNSGAGGSQGAGFHSLKSSHGDLWMFPKSMN